MPHTTDSHASAAREVKAVRTHTRIEGRNESGPPGLRVVAKGVAQTSPLSNAVRRQGGASGAGESGATAPGASRFVVELDEFRKLIAISQALTAAVIQLYTWAAVAGERLGIEETPFIRRAADGLGQGSGDQG